MKLAFVYEINEGDWSGTFVSSLTAGFADVGVDVHAVDLTGVARADIEGTINSQPAVDAWFLMHHFDWAAQAVLYQKQPAFAYVHSGPERYALGDANHEVYAAENRLGLFDAIFVSEEGYAAELRDGNPPLNAHAVGFPLELPNVETIGPKTIEVVIPGRVHPDKQPLLAFDAMKRLGIKHPVFCTGEDLHDPNNRLAEYARTVVDFLLDNGARVYTKCRGDAYYALLRAAEFAFTASRSDTLNISMIEAAASGAKVIAPDIVPFDGYLPPTNLYTPYCFTCVDAAFADAVRSSRLRFDRFDGKEVARAITKVITESTS